MSADDHDDDVFTGFTPAPDCIRDSLGIIAANVFGATWRFCQMRRRECGATVAKIAQRAGYGTTATRQSLALLVQHGWLEAEEHPGRATIYRDSGRWVLQVGGYDREEVPQRVALATPTRGVGVPQRVALPKKEELQDRVKEPTPSTSVEGGGHPPPREPTAHQLMYGEVCYGCGYAYECLDSNTQATIGRDASLYLKLGYTIEFVRDCAERWFTERFRGKPRSEVTHPTPAQFKTWLGKCWLAWREREEYRRQVAGVQDIAVAPRQEPTAGESMWAVAKSILRGEMMPATYKSWIEPLAFDSFAEGHLVLRAPSREIYDMATKRLRVPIDDALLSVYPDATLDIVPAIA